MIFYHSNDFIIILLRTNNLIIKKYITYNFMFILLPSYNFISKNSQELAVLFFFVFVIF